LDLFRFLYNEGFHASEFLLEAGREIVRAVFEEDDEAEREKEKQNEPKQPAEQRHGCSVTYSC
jgi:hypothetical protein